MVTGVIMDEKDFFKHNVIASIKSAYPGLVDTLDKIDKLHAFFETDIVGATSNYQTIVKNKIAQFPIGIDADNSLYPFGESYNKIDSAKAKISIEKYYNSLKALKYLSFLREEKRNVVFFPSGGCEKVVSNVKAYHKIKPLEKAYGIIDCDYKSSDYLTGQESNNVFHIPFFEIENMLVCESLILPVIKTYFASNWQDRFNSIKQHVKEKFVSHKDVWIARHVAFDLRDKFDYRGRISALANVGDFKTLYNAERLSDSEIDIIASQYETKFNTILRNDSYEEFLKHLDNRNILNECDIIMPLPNGKKYVEALFDFAKTDEGKRVLQSIRTSFFSAIA